MDRRLVTVVVAAGLLLGACGQEPEATPPAGEAVEITFMMWGAPEELEVWQAVVEDFEEANPAIAVQVDVSDWDSYWTKLNTMVAGGTPPDIFAMDAPYYLDWQSRGALLNLQPYIDKTPGFLEGFFPQTLTAYEAAEGYFGLPRDFQTIVVFYNQEMFDEADIPYPDPDWTYDDLREVAKQLTIDENGDGKIDQYGFYADLWDMELFWSEAIWAFGGDIISADHSKTLLGEAKAREAWEFIDSMVKDGSIPSPATAGEYGQDLFQSKVAAMAPIGHWAVPGYVQAGIQLGVAPMPVGPAGRATSVNSAGFVLAKESQNPDAAWEFVKFALSKAGQERLAALGFAVPVLKSVAESPAYLDQPGDLDQQLFLDALSYAHMKPVFRGYEEWSAAVGDGLSPVWDGDADLLPTLEEVVTAADEILAQNK